MLDTQPRLPAARPHGSLSSAQAAQAEQGGSRDPEDWQEASFTRPMRSPFAFEDEPRGPEPRGPEQEVDVALEEAALFEPATAPPAPEVRPRQDAPKSGRGARLPAPRFDAEATEPHTVSPQLLAAMKGERDSMRLLAVVQETAPVDLSKTSEEPTLGAEVRLARSGVRYRPTQRCDGSGSFVLTPSSRRSPRG